MAYVDARILDGVERLCRRFQLLTGRTNAWVAVQLTNLSIVVYFVWAIAYVWQSDLVSRTAVGLFCGGLLYVLSQTIWKMPIEAHEKSAYERVARGLRNPRRVRDMVLRTSFLTLSIVLFYPVVVVVANLHAAIVLLTYSLIVLTTVLLYVLACDPLPPCAGRLRLWRRASLPSPIPARSVRFIRLRGHLPQGGLDGPSASATPKVPWRRSASTGEPATANLHP